MNKPEYIVIHHSAGYDHPVIENWEGIRSYHKDVRGWRDIGYHYGIERVDQRPIIKYGRLSFENGAHAPGSNSKSLGVCVVGNFSDRPPENETLLVLMDLIWSLTLAFHIPANRVFGHREIMPAGYTECPGAAFPMADIKRWVASTHALKSAKARA
ncbi:MAG: N-acetylmuramoyl-L-alanine amidase [Deltaproteobacteria bacterium]|nr:N-acetylmuramoyl-L-alanine amidase [Deltaproteobacteria bacterium]